MTRILSDGRDQNGIRNAMAATKNSRGALGAIASRTPEFHFPFAFSGS